MLHFMDQRGFTLVEVLLTIVLLGVLTVSVVSIFSTATSRQRDQTDRTTAILLAQAQLEKIIADKNTKGYHFIKEKNYLHKKTAQTFQQMQIDSIKPGLKKIKIIVELNDLTDSLVTIIGDYK